jgi:hypothetical protein
VAQSVSIGTAWSETAAFVAREKRLLAPLVLALIVVPTTLAQLIQPANPLAAANGVAAWMAAALLALLIGLVGQMAISRLALGADRSLGATIALALRRLPATLGAFILFFLALSLLLIPLIVLLSLASGAAPGQQPGGGVDALLLLIIIASVPRILLAPALAMREPLGPLGLARAAWMATRGHDWRLLSFFLLFFVASLVFALAASSVIGSIATLALGPPEPLSVSRLVIALAGGVVQGVVATLYAAMIGRLLVQLPSGPINGM